MIKSNFSTNSTASWAHTLDQKKKKNQWNIREFIYNISTDHTVGFFATCTATEDLLILLSFKGHLRSPVWLLLCVQVDAPEPVTGPFGKTSSSDNKDDDFRRSKGRTPSDKWHINKITHTINIHLNFLIFIAIVLMNWWCFESLIQSLACWCIYSSWELTKLVPFIYLITLTRLSLILVPTFEHAFYFLLTSLKKVLN